MSRKQDGGRGNDDPPASEPDQEAVDHVSGILSETREELARAEGKAALLLAAIGVATGALLAALMGDKWTPFDIRNGLEWLWWGGALALAASVVLLATAIFPRTKVDRPKDQPPSYFADFAGFDTPAALGEALRPQDRSDAYERVAQQLYAVSEIVLRKYELLKSAIVLLGVAAVLCLGVALLDAIAP